jgi:hypothetical protein
MSEFPDSIFKVYTSILQISLENLEWRANIHGVEEHEARGDWEGGGILWVNLEVGSWFISTNHKQFFYY